MFEKLKSSAASTVRVGTVLINIILIEGPTGKHLFHVGDFGE